MSSKKEFDIVIAGGGLVGLSLAAVLGKAGFKVAVLEARQADFDWPEGSVDLRVYAITRASQELEIWCGKGVLEAAVRKQTIRMSGLGKH